MARDEWRVNAGIAALPALVTRHFYEHIDQSDRAGAEPQLAGHQRTHASRQEAFCMMATNVATGLEIEGENHIRPVTWEEWITLPIRDQDEAVHTVRGQIRVPTVIVAVNYAKVPKKRPKLCARTIRERDGNRCQYTGRLLHPDEGSLDHVVPRSRGGKDAWENLVWSAKEVNQRKADRLPHEAGLKLLSTPRAPKEVPVSALIRNAAEVEDWKLFLT
jgi:5-methylcytosine-specific restriction endonuclease McrA